MNKGGETSREIIDDLNRKFQVFNDRFSSQFHLQIPKSTLKTINFYRDHYFPYLKNSVYKSNICYLVQLLDYQIWLYKVFKPTYSLENAYFYQMLVTIGIIAEALGTCILLDPLINENEKDSSLGEPSRENHVLQEAIIRNNFQNNIKIMEKLNILDKQTTESFSNIRIEIRNLVHIQNWEGRLYQTLDIDQFSVYLEKFLDFLNGLKSRIQIQHSVLSLNKEFFNFHGENMDDLYFGTVVQFDRKKGFGFIKSDVIGRNLYFHLLNINDDLKNRISNGSRVKFHLIQGKKGIEGKVESVD